MRPQNVFPDILKVMTSKFLKYPREQESHSVINYSSQYVDKFASFKVYIRV